MEGSMETQELLSREDRSWGAFVDAFAAVPEGRREDQGVVPGWSVKDLVWHCGYWAGYVADLLERAAAGETTPDQDWDALNDLVIEQGRSMTWDEIIVRSEEHRERVRAALGSFTELTGELLEDVAGETYDHYDEHAAEIRAFSTA
jgi:hypothetical protein